MLKKLSIKLLICCTTLLVNASPPLVIENHYGSTIVIRINNTEEQRIKNGSILSLGSIDELYALEVRTTGTGSGFGLAPYSSLNKYLEQAQYSYEQHPNKNPVLIINPSGYISLWNVNLIWQSETTLGLFDLSETYINFFLSKTGEERVRGIIGGALGPDYAQMASDICNTSYKHAQEKLGKVNLCEYLQRVVVAPEYRVSARSTGIGPDSPEMEPLIDEIKQAVVMVYRTLLRYQSHGWVRID